MASRRKKWSQLTAAEQRSERSKRAKKGWQTRWKKKALRRARGERERALNVLKALPEELRESILEELGGLPKTLRQRLAKVGELEAVRKQSVRLLMHYEQEAERERERFLVMVEEKTGTHWVNSVSPEYVRKDGSIGIVANAARHTLDSESYHNIFVMMRMAVQEHGRDSEEVKQTAIQLSQHYDISLREVWTILMSP